jgi:hypothetical protein
MNIDYPTSLQDGYVFCGFPVVETTGYNTQSLRDKELDRIRRRRMGIKTVISTTGKTII